MNRISASSLATALCFLAAAVQSPREGLQPLPGNPQPVYPASAAPDAVMGRVELAVNVNTDGRPGRIRTIFAGPPGYDFEKAAKDAVERWRFEPAPGARKTQVYTARFDFRPGLPMHVRWVPDRNARASFRESDQVLQLKSGWIRTPRWFSNFVMDFEFRAAEEGTEAALLIHAQLLRDNNYVAYKSVLADAGRNRAIGEIIEGELPFRRVGEKIAPAAPQKAAGDWQTARIEAFNGGLRISVNGATRFAAADLARTTGHIGLDVSSGSLEVRSPRVDRRDTYLRGTGDTADRVGTSGLIPPRVEHEVRPQYSTQAMANRVEGDVWLEAVILPDGSVSAPRVTRSLDLDLDQAAVAAVRRWRFKPETKDGKPVPVLVEFELSFRLK